CTRDCETCEQRLIGQCRRCDCSNGGTRRPEATPSNCRCTCPIGYFGRQCQVTLARYKNSVALRLGVRGPGKLSMSLEPDLLQLNQNGELMVYVRAAMVSAIQDPVLCYHSDKLNPKTNPPSSDKDPEHIPPYLIQEAIRSSKSWINEQLSACCENAVIKEFNVLAIVTAGGPRTTGGNTGTGWMRSMAMAVVTGLVTFLYM
uniref:EGF-like domain-containing protein n=1 Tax=Macrostomum lignano TaxID=282301 RepID=A0A1I8GRF6_9PLAT